MLACSLLDGLHEVRRHRYGRLPDRQDADDTRGPANKAPACGLPVTGEQPHEHVAGKQRLETSHFRRRPAAGHLDEGEIRGNRRKGQAPQNAPFLARFHLNDVPLRVAPRSEIPLDPVILDLEEARLSTTHSMRVDYHDPLHVARSILTPPAAGTEQPCASGLPYPTGSG